MSKSKVESYILENDMVEVPCVLGERIKTSDKPSMFGADTLLNTEEWLAEKVAEKFKRTEEAASEDGVKPLKGHLSNITSPAAFFFRNETLKRLAASLERDSIPEFEGPLDGRLLAAQVAPHPTPPVTKAVLFDNYPLRHVVGYSLIEQWVEVLVFDDDDRPIWDGGKWRTERLSGKVEALTDKSRG